MARGNLIGLTWATQWNVLTKRSHLLGVEACGECISLSWPGCRSCCCGGMFPFDVRLAIMFSDEFCRACSPDELSTKLTRWKFPRRGAKGTMPFVLILRTHICRFASFRQQIAVLLRYHGIKTGCSA